MSTYGRFHIRPVGDEMGDVQAAAQARVEKRCQEIVETESGMCASILALTDKLEEVQQVIFYPHYVDCSSQWEVPS